ncbi:MAG: hypothetical protein PHE67_06700 [Campylobacterales bacterium]|nr:hypothetical protein [Campylobacterales bacterium]
MEKSNTDKSMKVLLSAKEVADEYGITAKLQVTLRHKRKIQYTKIGRDCVYKREWIEEYLERNVVKAAV